MSEKLADGEEKQIVYEISQQCERKLRNKSPVNKSNSPSIWTKVSAQSRADPAHELLRWRGDRTAVEAPMHQGGEHISYLFSFLIFCALCGAANQAVIWYKYDC